MSLSRTAGGQDPMLTFNSTGHGVSVARSSRHLPPRSAVYGSIVLDGLVGSVSKLPPDGGQLFPFPCTSLARLTCSLYLDKCRSLPAGPPASSQSHTFAPKAEAGGVWCAL